MLLFVSICVLFLSIVVWCFDDVCILADMIRMIDRYVFLWGNHWKRTWNMIRFPHFKSELGFFDVVVCINLCIISFYYGLMLWCVCILADMIRMIDRCVFLWGSCFNNIKQLLSGELTYPVRTFESMIFLLVLLVGYVIVPWRATRTNNGYTPVN